MNEIAFKSYIAAIADPAWQWDAYSEKGLTKSAQRHYETMATPDIIALREKLKLDFVFAPDAILVLWGTWPMMARGDVHAVMRGWGFNPITGGAWHKITKHGKDSFGGGYIFRDSCEPFLVGVRGDPGLPKVRNIRNGFRALRRAHSQKPDYIHRALEKMYPGGPYLELNAIDVRKGWDGWGEEYGKRHERKPKPNKKKKSKSEPEACEPEPPPEPGSLLAKMTEDQETRV